jgi:hypothetical protein
LTLPWRPRSLSNGFCQAHNHESVGEPGFVYAIDGSNEHGYTICEFAVVGDRLGKLAKAKAA